ncbi:MAG: hypothetical protein HY901_38460, partial [Deltaproteobacteria bacterium]|nr:hypothetical protein [Deltaproteobacteria bacterium]
MPAVTFADHEGFQKTVVRASLGSAAAGLVMYGLSLAGVPNAEVFLPLACASAAGAACGKTWKGRGAYGLLGGIAGSLPFFFLHHPTFGLAMAGAGVGGLFAHFRQKEAGAGNEVGQSRMGKAAYVAAA